MYFWLNLFGGEKRRAVDRRGYSSNQLESDRICVCVCILIDILELFAAVMKRLNYGR